MFYKCIVLPMVALSNQPTSDDYVINSYDIIAIGIAVVASRTNFHIFGGRVL